MLQAVLAEFKRSSLLIGPLIFTLLTRTARSYLLRVMECLLLLLKHINIV